MSDDVGRIIDILDFSAHQLNTKCKEKLNRRAAYNPTWMTWGTAVVYMTIPPLPGYHFNHTDVALLRESGWRKVPDVDTGGRNTWLIRTEVLTEAYDEYVRNEKHEPSG